MARGPVFKKFVAHPLGQFLCEKVAKKAENARFWGFFRVFSTHLLGNS